MPVILLHYPGRNVGQFTPELTFCMNRTACYLGTRYIAKHPRMCESPFNLNSLHQAWNTDPALCSHLMDLTIESLHVENILAQICVCLLCQQQCGGEDPKVNSVLLQGPEIRRFEFCFQTQFQSQFKCISVLFNKV